MVYFTADPHFYHENFIRYEQRPFQTAAEMNEALIHNWNARVSDEDDVYILGDLTLKGATLANALLERLNGRKYLVRGNHDGYADQSSFRRELLVWVRDYFELCWQGRYFILCHYPLLSWNGMHRGAFQLHGHQHNSPWYNRANRQNNVRRLDVGVDANGMTPVSAAEILAFWDEVHGGAAYGRIKPGDIRLEMTSLAFPEQYDAFDKEGNQIGYLRVGTSDFRVECPDCGGDEVYAAFPDGYGSFTDGERDGFLEKAKRAIARYYRDKKQSGGENRS